MSPSAEPAATPAGAGPDFDRDSEPTPEVLRAVGEHAEQVAQCVSDLVSRPRLSRESRDFLLGQLFRSARALRLYLGFPEYPNPLAQALRAVSDGPPGGWPQATAVEVCARIARRVTGIPLDLPDVGSTERRSEFVDRMCTDPEEVPEAVRAALAARFRQPRTLVPWGPVLTEAALADLHSAVGREVARALKLMTPAESSVPSKSEENPEPEREPMRPVWDKASRRLFWGEQLLKHYRGPSASAQETVLDAFQAAEWPASIPSPFGDNEDKLRNTVRGLNKSIRPPGRGARRRVGKSQQVTIRFHSELATRIVCEVVARGQN